MLSVVHVLNTPCYQSHWQVLKANPEFEPVLRTARFLTRDSRQKERKKYGRRGARRGFQFSKR